MTPDELARLTGYSRQTINKWVRKEGWTTSPKPGVQGGKARLVHVNEQVRETRISLARPPFTPGNFSVFQPFSLIQRLTVCLATPRHSASSSVVILLRNLFILFAIANP